MSDWDSRVNDMLNDQKAGTAAIDDSRCTATEILEENPPLSPRDRFDLECIKEEQNFLLTRSDALIGRMTRFMERLQ